jgi:hypothetical protein
MQLYHGSTQEIHGPLEPVLIKETEDHAHVMPMVFATERKDVAALFMFPWEILASIGFEEDVAYICIWGTKDAYMPHDRPGYVYVLPEKGFIKQGKDYEWQSKEAVIPNEVIVFPSVLEGMMACGVQVYFINDEAIFDQIVANKTGRMPLLRKLTMHI